MAVSGPGRLVRTPAQAWTPFCYICREQCVWASGSDVQFSMVACLCLVNHWAFVLVCVVGVYYTAVRTIVVCTEPRFDHWKPVPSEYRSRFVCSSLCANNDRSKWRDGTQRTERHSNSNRLYFGLSTRSAVCMRICEQHRTRMGGGVERKRALALPWLE